MHSRLNGVWAPHKIIIACIALLFCFPALAASTFQEYCNNPTEKQKETVWFLFSYNMPGSVNDGCLDCTDCKKLEKILKRTYGAVHISDLGFLKFFPHMTNISIYHEAGDIDLSQLKRLKNIKQLSVESDSLTDFSVIGELTTLRSLNVEVGTGDFSSFNNLVNLRYLTLLGGMKNLPKFDRLKKLERLHLGGGGNRIKSIQNIKYLTNLKALNLDYNDVASLEGVESLSELKKLSSKETNIQDLMPLSGLANLTELSLYGNNISDLSPLVPLTKLRSLHASSYGLKFCSPRNLKEIKLGISCQNSFFTNMYRRWLW